MDIRVGGAAAIGQPGDKTATGGGFVEARVLAVRPPRRRSGTPPPHSRERRDGDEGPDPATGRVLILMIPDGRSLPEGLSEGAWRVFLRFARR